MARRKYMIHHTPAEYAVDHKDHFSILFLDGRNILGGENWSRAINRSYGTREEAEKALREEIGWHGSITKDL